LNGASAISLGGVAGFNLQGRAFVGRVAASLLHAVGIPELITSNLVDYVDY
jgi:predicted O-linked N-acetylglucosamine transferase (SPINDLY family)